MCLVISLLTPIPLAMCDGKQVHFSNFSENSCGLIFTLFVLPWFVGSICSLKRLVIGRTLLVFGVFGSLVVVSMLAPEGTHIEKLLSVSLFMLFGSLSYKKLYTDPSGKNYYEPAA